ncbi:hypothetical protein QBC37DRAFT_187469 [Rhypophila decipiens]|uniref:Uncharacterized protein n=1 Tax=Rhypophila decipiens TaxID=261697 RepID=A0AAN6Y4Y4_9PEZI|nr:hypothetical protein QBC37DRAFT_187469 [Rhypophila decipiens]
MAAPSEASYGTIIIDDIDDPRPIGHIYWDPETFLPEQWATFDDVWAPLLASIPGAHFDNGRPDNMWKLVFRDQWNSTWAPEAEPIIHPRIGGQSMIPCGKFKEDLPVAAARELKPARTKGQQAYIKIHVHRRTHQAPFVYCDSAGMMASKHYIEIHRDRQDYFKESHFLVSAICHYDEVEVARVKDFNVMLARHIIRRRLNYWTENGWTRETEVPGEEELLTKFEKLHLARNDKVLLDKILEVVPEEEMIPLTIHKRFLAIPGMWTDEGDSDEE